MTIIHRYSRSIFFFSRIFIFGTRGFTSRRLNSTVVAGFFLGFGRFLVGGTISTLFVHRGVFGVDGYFRDFLMFNVSFFAFRSYRTGGSRIRGNLDLLIERFVLIRRTVLNCFTTLEVSSSTSSYVSVIGHGFRTFRGVYSYLHFFRIGYDPTAGSILLVLRMVLRGLLWSRRSQDSISSYRRVRHRQQLRRDRFMRIIRGS